MKWQLVNENFKTDYVKNLLKERGIDDLQTYMAPTVACLNPSSRLKNIDQAARLVRDTVHLDGKYAVVVDCDCDGYCASAILYQYIKQLNPYKEIDYYIHSAKQHGLSDLWKDINEQDYDIVFLPDAGTNDGDFIEKMDKHFNFIISDHHDYEEGRPIPSNMIIVNNQMSEAYTNKSLSGAGVTWQMCRAIDFLMDRNYANDFYDLVALSIISDMMLVNNYENRYLIKKGLENIKNSFFKVLLDKQAYSMQDQVNPISIAFYIVPLINAMVRAGTQAEKVRMFLAFIDGSQMVECHKRGAAGTMERVDIESARECTNAKSRQNRTKEQVASSLEAKIYKHDLLSNQILFVRLDDEDDFPAELNGLIAMSFVAKFKKPVILGRLKDGYIKGSIRAPGETELSSFKEYLLSTGLFEYVQGHDFAAGMSLPAGSLSLLHEKANEELAHIDFGLNCYNVSFERSAADHDVYELLSELCRYQEIWGQGNQPPMVAIKDLYLQPEDYRILGAKSDTLRIEKFGVTYIMFHATDIIQQIQGLKEPKLNLVGNASINSWNGRETVQFIVKDCDVTDGQFGF